MSNSGPPMPNVEILLERMQDYDGYMYRKYGEKIERYQQAGRLARLTIDKLHPEIARYISYREAQRQMKAAK